MRVDVLIFTMFCVGFRSNLAIGGLFPSSCSVVV